MLKRLFLLLFLFISACKGVKNNDISSNINLTPFTLLTADETGIAFENKVTDQDSFNVLTYRNYYNGGGVAIGDINNDGLNDIFFTANMGDNKLYLNKGKHNGKPLSFEDITEKAGVKGKNSWATGVTFADVNADGFLDIYVCYSGDADKENKENELFINNKNATFTEKAKEYGLNDAGLSTHASFFDYDLDGDLDCYVLNNSYKNPERISLYSRQRFEYDALGGDRLYKNENGKFINATKESGIYSSNIGFGLGISVGDVNGDFYPDIYISNDFWERDYLYLNQKNGTFKETLTENISYTSVSSMGADMADINNDGKLDIFTTDMLPPDNYRLKAATKFDDYYLYDLKFRNSYYYQFVQNCLQINKGDGTFQETAHFSGVSATDWSWGALIFDMNLDGKKDIFVSNGVYHDITDADFIDFIADKEEIKKVVEENGRYSFKDFVKYLPHNKRKNYAFINNGTQNSSPMKFDNLAKNLNLDQESYSNGSAYGDLDNDGDQDLVVNNVNMPAFVYRNNAVEDKKTKFIKFKLKGSKNNPFGIGSTINIYHKGNLQTAHSTTARGFQSSVDSDFIFGLGDWSGVDSLRIIWSDLKTQLISNPKFNQTTILDYKNAIEKYIPRNLFPNPTFKETSNALIVNALHKENQYVDFDFDRLMPHVLSTQSPKLIHGDVNKDGREDFILQGAKGSADKLFINQENKFTISVQKSFDLEMNVEKTAGALFDADADGDLDYLAGVGGNEYKDGFKTFASLFYENDGKGNFTKQDLKGPKFNGQVSCVKPFDFDNDGDLDLFIGGNAVPGAYGLNPRSFVLRNQGNGNWEDLTNNFTGPMGMVTDAVWTDVNGDKYTDLIVVGEWMPVTVFVNEMGVLGNPLMIPNSNGWWNTIEATDIDQDGDTDFMLGNWGLNMKLKASNERPLNLYVNDFDDNKRPEVIMEWFSPEDEKPYPFASKADLTGQMPSLKKSILKYQDYAQKQVKDLFESSKLEKAIKKTVSNFRSSILLNQNGNLVLESLQDEAQMSPIFAFEAGDFDADGITDFFAGGNFYRLKPEIGRHDGNAGGYFKGLGKGKFKFISSLASGIKVKGEVRDAITINKRIIVSRNDDSVLIFEKK
jgi:enediyne biosynthesis protein E4